MYQVLQLLTLCLFAGTTCAVFYIPGSVVSYPKMGKRAFYTNATGNRYPLMGRRSSPSDQDTESRENVVGAMIQDDGEYNKRGVFTQGPHRSFPRVGRSGSADDSPSLSANGRLRSDILKGLAERLNQNLVDTHDGSDISSLLQGQGQDSTDSNASNDLQLPQFLFLIFDEDNNNQLSKSEFYAGVTKIVEQNILCW